MEWIRILDLMGDNIVTFQANTGMDDIQVEVDRPGIDSHWAAALWGPGWVGVPEDGAARLVYDRLKRAGYQMEYRVW